MKKLAEQQMGKVESLLQYYEAVDQCNDIEKRLEKIFRFIEFHLGKIRQESEEVFLASSVQQDFRQVNIKNESFPFSQEELSR